MSFPSFSTGEVLTAADMNAAGLWLVKTQTVGTGVSSVTVTGAFSADYANYRIVYEGGAGSVLHLLQLQLKVGGGATSTTGYYQGFVGTTFAGAGAAAGVNNGTAFIYSGGGDGNFSNLCVDVFGPFATRFTKTGNFTWYGTYGGAATGAHAVSTSYADFVITTTAGTITGGTIRVYGYRN